MGWLLAQPLDPQARRAQPVRLLLGCVLGAASLLALAWPLAHRAHLTRADARFREDLMWIGEDETRALQASRQLWTKLQSHRITQGVWAAQTAGNVVPIWSVMGRRIDADALPTASPMRALRQALLVYIDDRRDALQLLSQGVMRNSGADISQGNELIHRSDESGLQVRQLIKQVE